MKTALYASAAAFALAALRHHRCHGADPRPDPHRRFVDRVPVHAGRRRAVRGRDRQPGSGCRVRPAPAAACRCSAKASAPIKADITGASRAMKKSEFEACVANGVDSVTEVLIGYDGLSLAHTQSAPDMSLTKAQIFQALAVGSRSRRRDRRQPLQELERDRRLAPEPADHRVRPPADLRHARRLRRARDARRLRPVRSDQGSRRRRARKKSASACARTARSSKPARTTT